MDKRYEVMDFSIRIANKNIAVHSVYSYIHDSCGAYLTDTNEKSDIEIFTDKNMIEAETERIRRNDGLKHSAKIIEGMLIHRLIAEAFLEYDTFLMHGAVVATDNGAYMFTGQSGTGKTTHVLKWLENAEGSYIVNGDKPLIMCKDGVYACGTPWSGKENYNRNTIVPLKSIVLMERNTENRMVEMPFRAVFPFLLQQTYQPAEADKMRKTLALLMKIKDSVRFYRFYFDNYKDDCFQVSYDALTKQ